MSEFVRQAVEHGPVVIGTVVGYGVGSAMEFHTQRQIQSQRAAISRHLGGIAEQPSFARRAGAAFGGVLALMGAATGGVNANAWSSEPGIETVTPGVEVVVDMSGTLAFDGEARDQLVGLTEAIDAEDFDVHGTVARGGITESVDPSDTAEVSPLGGAPLARGIHAAIGDIEQDRDDAFGDRQIRNGAVVLLTNGNSVGDSRRLAREAEDANVPIHVVNVRPVGETSDEVLEDYQRLAERTGGEFLGRRVDEDDLIDVIEESLETAQIEDPSVGENEAEKTALKILGVALVLGMIGMKRRANDLKTNIKNSRQDNQPSPASPTRRNNRRRGLRRRRVVQF